MDSASSASVAAEPQTPLRERRACALINYATPPLPEPPHCWSKSMVTPPVSLVRRSARIWRPQSNDARRFPPAAWYELSCTSPGRRSSPVRPRRRPLWRQHRPPRRPQTFSREVSVSLLVPWRHQHCHEVVTHQRGGGPNKYSPLRRTSLMLSS